MPYTCTYLLLFSGPEASKGQYRKEIAESTTAKFPRPQDPDIIREFTAVQTQYEIVENVR